MKARWTSPPICCEHIWNKPILTCQRGIGWHGGWLHNLGQRQTSCILHGQTRTMNLQRLPWRWATFVCFSVACLILLTVIVLAPGQSPKISVGVRVLAEQSGEAPPSVLLSATNQTSRDYAFACCVEVLTNSRWSNVGRISDDIRTLRVFRKGQVVQLEVELPPKEGIYRFRCFYQPLLRTPWSSRAHHWLMGLKLPGKLGIYYRQFLGRLQPWPRSFTSTVFEIKASAQPDGPANGSQPIRSEINRTSAAAGSRR